MTDKGKPYLKPCPFCGEIADVVRVERAVIEECDSREDLCWEWWVLCQNCGAMGPPCSKQEHAVKSWNARKNGKSELIRVKDHDHDLTGAGK